MAILDSHITGSFIEDRDENIFVGIDLPFHKSDGVDGYFGSTTTTIQAVKNNIRAFLLTNKGERLMQPNLGLSLRQYLFEPITEDLMAQIQTEIKNSIDFWFPFVTIRDLKISDSGSSRNDVNTLNIFLTFNINKNPNILESVQVTITGE